MLVARRYRHVLKSQMSVVLAGVECKWRATHPQRDEFDLGACRAAFAYARQNKQQFRGHNLGSRIWG